MKEIAARIISSAFMVVGCLAVSRGDVTNGVLLLILGQLFDLPYRMRDAGK